MEQIYEVWVEISANKKIILDEKAFRDSMEKCKEAGMTGIILSVKDTSGFVIYKSSFAKHYSFYDADFKPETDYVKQCFGIIRSLGMKCYAAFDVFTEGNKKKKHPFMKGFTPGWECEVYGLDKNGNAVIRKSTESFGLKTAGSIDDFGEIFVNPGKEEVRQYELNLLGEFCENYHPDGIVLDRVRYVGLSTDFSEYTRKDWEKYTNIYDENWPEDIYRLKETGKGVKEEPGKYYGSFFEYRAKIIKSFVEEVSRMLKTDFPDVEFCNYTGSWYPLYHLVGANWAGSKYQSHEFFWCDAKKLKETAYGDIPDRLLSGFYYSDVWITEAEEKDLPAPWYTVEGAYEMASKITCNKKGMTGSLFIEQYRECPERLQEAMSVCFQTTGGCMIFDLSYIHKYDWWKFMKKVSLEPLEKKDIDKIADICAGVFDKSYTVTKERIYKNLFEDADFCSVESRKIVDEQTKEILGFIGVKISHNEQLYLDTAWISILAIDQKEQKKGYGRMLLNHTCQSLKKRGIKKIYAGQDFHNFFSGIPEPDKNKERFFGECGFKLNFEPHYDLEAELTGNEAIDNFDLNPFEEYYVTDTYKKDKEKLLRFLKEEFPGRWEYEAKEKIREIDNSENIVILWKKDKTEIAGYCMISVDANGNGGLGPIGIAKKIRGGHVGDYLLNQSLRQLKKNGAVRVNVDWTILKDFYGQFGLEAKRTYLAAYKDWKEKRG